jgi:cytochrome c oxidase subunit 2
VRKLFTILSGLGVSALGSLAIAGHAVAANLEPWRMGLPEPVTPLAHQMANFHNYWLMPIITAITIFVLILLVYVCWRFRESANPVPSKTTHNSLLEVLWTGVPVLILVVMAFPSLKLLYATDEVEDSEMTVKIVGHQWYWEYQYPDNGNFFIEARIAATTEEEAKEQNVNRLMSTDEKFVLPANTKIRLQMTSADVLHNWSMSDFGVRMDTVPGRLNEAWTLIEKPGVYYGFCSEVCGDAHAFMPIEVHVLPKEEFNAWAEQARTKYDPVEQARAPSVSQDVATSPAQAVE